MLRRTMLGDKLNLCQGALMREHLLRCTRCDPTHNAQPGMASPCRPRSLCGCAERIPQGKERAEEAFRPFVGVYGGDLAVTHGKVGTA